MTGLWIWLPLVSQCWSTPYPSLGFMILSCTHDHTLPDFVTRLFREAFSWLYQPAWGYATSTLHSPQIGRAIMPLWLGMATTPWCWWWLIWRWYAAHAGRVHPMPIVFGLGAERHCCVVWLVDASMGFCYFASRSRLLSVLAPQRLCHGIIWATDCLVETPAACVGCRCYRDPRGLWCDYRITIGVRGDYSVAVVYLLRTAGRLVISVDDSWYNTEIWW